MGNNLCYFSVTDALSVRVSSDRRLSCQNEASVIGIEWFRRNASLPDESEIIIVDDSKFTVAGSELTIRNVSGKYEGEYSCIPQVEGGQLPTQLLGCLVVRGKMLFHY